MPKCATCYRDPAIAHWHDPQKVRPRGTSQSNWVCNKCLRKPVNRSWTCTPNAEVYGVDDDTLDRDRAEGDSQEGDFETPRCVEIMRLYCFGLSQRVIAQKTSIPLSYVAATVEYWKTHRGYFVSRVKELLTKDEGCS